MCSTAKLCEMFIRLTRVTPLSSVAACHRADLCKLCIAGLGPVFFLPRMTKLLKQNLWPLSAPLMASVCPAIRVDAAIVTPVAPAAHDGRTTSLSTWHCSGCHFMSRADLLSQDRGTAFAALAVPLPLAPLFLGNRMLVLPAAHRWGQSHNKVALMRACCNAYPELLNC